MNPPRGATQLPKGLWIREVRKLTAVGEQIFVGKHPRGLEAEALAAALFARGLRKLLPLHAAKLWHWIG